MISKRAFFLAVSLLAVSCRAPEKDDHIADEVAEEAEPAPSVADSEAVEDPEYDKRVASMASYEDCLKQAEGLEPVHERIVKKACESRRKAPK